MTTDSKLFFFKLGLKESSKGKILKDKVRGYDNISRICVEPLKGAS